MKDLDIQLNGSTPLSIQDASPASTLATLSGIFFAPGETFEALHRRPRFLAAGLIILASILTFNFLLIRRIGYENVLRSQLESHVPNMDSEQKEEIIQRQSTPAFKTLGLLSPLVNITLISVIGAALYLVGAIWVERVISYRQSFSVWTYSSLPPTLLLVIANIAVVFLLPSSMLNVNRALVRAHPGVLLNSGAHPLLAAALARLDLFSMYGLFLAVIGLHKVGRLSVRAATGVVLTIWLLGVLLHLGMVAMFGKVVP
jgi:hypothetical protein